MRSVSANDSENGLPRYDAFIAYSHAKDKPIASALQSVVQKLGKPGTGGGLCACFATTEPVGDAASVAFDRDRAWSGQSRYLILLASPEAAR